MHFQPTELFGVAAAIASLYAAQSKTIIPLRWALIAANALAMIYSALHGTYPTFALNAILLPINAWRLHAMLRLIGEIDTAIKSDMSADWLLPYSRPKNFKAGDIMMASGDYATAAFYIVSGEVEIPDLGRTFGKGTLLGEIGLLRRTAAAPAPWSARPTCTPPCSTTTGSRSCTSRTRSSASACWS